MVNLKAFLRRLYCRLFGHVIVTAQFEPVFGPIYLCTRCGKFSRREWR